MKPENKQRFSIRKYAIGAASVLIGFAFHAQAVAADGVITYHNRESTYYPSYRWIVSTG